MTSRDGWLELICIVFALEQDVRLSLNSLLINALCILAWVIAPSAMGQALIPATNLAADGAEARSLHAPLLILFSEASCPWCERVRREHLSPMQRDAAYTGRVLIREVDTGSDAMLTDFSGKRASQREFAHRYNVRRVPVVALFGPAGEALVEPMVGMSTPDFYQFYLDDAIAKARARLGATSP